MNAVGVLMSLVFIAIGLGMLYGRAQGIVDRYADGAPVTVYYNPIDPSDAVLERGGTSGIGVLYIIGGVFAAAGLVFLFGSVTGRVHTS